MVVKGKKRGDEGTKWNELNFEGETNKMWLSIRM